MAAGQNQWYNFRVGEFTAHFRTYFSGWIESDVHWGYDLAWDFEKPMAKWWKKSKHGVDSV